MSVRHALDALAAALFAPPCATCGRVLDRPLEGAVCQACWDAIAPRPSRFALRDIPSAAAIGPYEGALRDILHALKYDGRRSIARRLGRLMAAHGGDVLENADLVVPVPLHRRRQRERGFNQSDDLARCLGRPVLHALDRIRPTRPQVDLPAEARRANVNDAFASRRAVDGHIVVLVDDVTTTGATLEACARVLRRAGAAEVRALTAARVANGRR